MTNVWAQNQVITRSTKSSPHSHGCQDFANSCHEPLIIVKILVHDYTVRETRFWFNFTRFCVIFGMIDCYFITSNEMNSYTYACL